MRTLVHPTVPGGDIREVTRRLLCQSQIALEPPLRRDFLHVLDYLRSIPPDDQTEATGEIIQWWQALGASVGITEGELRAELVAGMEKTTTSEASGCSWARCVRFQQDGDRHVFFQCAQCQKAMYCGSLCQRR